MCVRIGSKYFIQHRIGYERHKYRITTKLRGPKLKRQEQQQQKIVTAFLDFWLMLFIYLVAVLGARMCPGQ